MSIENPILGRPYCVLHVDHDRYRVEVLEHARNVREAEATRTAMQDHLGPNHAVLVVSSDQLVGWLEKLRSEVAERMNQWAAT